MESIKEELKSYDNDNSVLLSDLMETITETEVEDLGIDISNEKFRITNDEQAMFFIRKINELRDEKDKINNTCDRIIEKHNTTVNDFRAKELRGIEGTENYFSLLLEDYAKRELDGSKKKSLKFPFGTLSFKKTQPKYVYDDQTVFNYIKENHLDSCIRVKEEINKSELKKMIRYDEETNQGFIDDQPVDGLSILPPEEKFSIK